MEMSLISFCKDHWEQCHQAIKDRGLWHLVSEDGEEAVERTISGAEREFDPLLLLNLMITQAAIGCLGELLKGDEPVCPLCRLDDCGGDSDGETSEDWIKGAADTIEEKCKELNLQG